MILGDAVTWAMNSGKVWISCPTIQLCLSGPRDNLVLSHDPEWYGNLQQWILGRSGYLALQYSSVSQAPGIILYYPMILSDTVTYSNEFWEGLDISPCNTAVSQAPGIILYYPMILSDTVTYSNEFWEGLDILPCNTALSLRPQG